MEQGTKIFPDVEEWRDIAGFEGIYQVSSLGRVRSLDRYVELRNKWGTVYNRFQKGQIIIPRLNNGYYQLRLGEQSNRKGYKVHRLVAQAFIPNPDNLPEVNHKDECPSNNLPSNLEWCTRLYNANYGKHYEHISKKLSKRVEQLTLDGRHVAYFDSCISIQRVTEGKYLFATIAGVLRGRRKTAYGYQWRYI